MAPRSRTLRRLAMCFALAMGPLGCGLLLGLEDRELETQGADSGTGGPDAGAPEPLADATVDVAVTDAGGDAADAAIVWPAYTTEPFAAAQRGPWGISIDDVHVYWSNETEGTIRRRAKVDDAGIVELAHGLPHPEDLSAGPTAISWIASNAPALFLEPGEPGGDAGPATVTVAGRIERFADGGSGLVVVDRDDSERKYRRLTRGRFKPDGGVQTSEADFYLRQSNVVKDDRAAISLVAGSSDWDAVALAVGATDLWVALNGPGLVRAPLDGSSSPVVVSEDVVADVTTDGIRPIWLTRGGAIRTLDGSGKTLTISQGDPAPFGRIALDSSYIVWLRADQDTPTEGQILLARRDGTTPTAVPVANHQYAPRGLTTERDARGVLVVYFTTYGDGFIKRTRIVPEP